MTKSDWLRSEIEKLEGIEKLLWKKVEILDNGAIMTIDNKIRLYGFKRMTNPLMYEYVLTKDNQVLASIITRYKEELKELEKTNE